MIYIYYHIALIGDHARIVNNTVNKILSSKLYEAVNSINCLVYKDVTEFEYPTLNKLYEHSIVEDAYFLYIHTKGVNPDWAHINQEHLADWRNLMEYFTIEKWKKCVESLEKYDTIGVNFGYKPYKHYSGNFWWSKSSYLRTLEKPKRTKNRFEHEAWIGTGNINPCLLHSSNVNHYYSLYPKSKYEVI